MNLRYLPEAPDTFVGRTGHLENIRSYLQRRRLIFLEGIGGIGKTSVALALANALEETHPGKVFWISMDEGERSVMQAREAIFHYLLANRSGEAKNLLRVYGEKLYFNGYYDDLLQFTRSLDPSDFTLLTLRANVLIAIGQLAEAIESLKEIEKNTMDDRELGYLYHSPGIACLWKGKLQEALQYNEKALTFFRRINDGKSIVKVLNNISIVHLYNLEIEKMDEPSKMLQQ